MSAPTTVVTAEPQKLEKPPVKFSNLLLGAGLNMFEVTTLGQPLEVTKTTMAAHRGDSFASALGRIWGRGGPLGCTSILFLRLLCHLVLLAMFSQGLPPSLPCSAFSHVTNISCP